MWAVVPAVPGCAQFAPDQCRERAGRPFVIHQSHRVGGHRDRDGEPVHDGPEPRPEQSGRRGDHHDRDRRPDPVSGVPGGPPGEGPPGNTQPARIHPAQRVVSPDSHPAQPPPVVGTAPPGVAGGVGAVGVFCTPSRLSSHLPIPSPRVVSNPIVTTASETMTRATVSSTFEVSPLREAPSNPRPMTKMISGSALSFSQPVIPVLDTETSARYCVPTATVPPILVAITGVLLPHGFQGRSRPSCTGVRVEQPLKIYVPLIGHYGVWSKP